MQPRISKRTWEYHGHFRMATLFTGVGLTVRISFFLSKLFHATVGAIVGK